MTPKKKILIVGCLIKNGKNSIFVEANKGTISCVICNDSVTVLIV